MKNVKLQKKSISEVVEILNNGGVAVCPTDTVYGFLADATNKKAVEKIFKIKKRPRSKPLAVFVKDIKMAKELAKIDERQEKILREYWPGKHTFILKSKCQNLNFKSDPKSKIKNKISKLVIGKGNTIGIRIPKYKFLNNLLKKINKPLAQTSVNISGQPVLTKISAIIKIIARSERAMLIIDEGDLPKNAPSTIIDLTGNNIKIIRK